MTFLNFRDLMQKQFLVMQGYKLFRSSVTGERVWDLYLNSFTKEHDPIFRDPNSSYHNGNLDNNFIRRYGNIVAINEANEVITLFDFEVEQGTEYYNSVVAMRTRLKEAIVTNVFVETYDELNSLPYESCNKKQESYRLGFVSSNKIYNQDEVNKFGVVEPGKVYTFNHMYLDLPTRFVDKTGSSVDSIMGNHRSFYDVFYRAMKEIPLDTLELVRDLIVQGSLLNGDSYLQKVKDFIVLKTEFNALPNNPIIQNNWCWIKSYGLPIAKFRNELIGTLCVELAEGMELNNACLNWNKRADPVNYMKASAPITQKQIGEAKKFVQDEGYEESFDRRFATLTDINVSEILFANAGTGAIKTASVFDKVAPSTSTRHKRAEFDGIEEVQIDKFMKEILPTCTGIELFLENRLNGNLVALHTANNSDSKKMFKWSNNFGWTYNGNLAGKSMIKETVKSKGGKVDGVLRFSIMWAEKNGDNSDLDAHCIEPNRNEIYFSSKTSYHTGGNLDVDITQPQTQMPTGAVENITYPSLTKMQDGVYKFFVHQYSGRNSKGFKAEIEFGGESFQYEYNKAVSGNIQVALVTLKNGVFTIEHKLPETSTSKKMWNLDSGQFHKVNLACLSPNFWAENNIGNKHYLFMLEGCATDIPLRSFHNEYLNGDLLAHRKVLEVLGETTKLEPTTNQLAGVGFNATVQDEVILKLTGSHKRTIKIKF